VKNNQFARFALTTPVTFKNLPATAFKILAPCHSSDIDLQAQLLRHPGHALKVSVVP